jgi:hypothetical protein
LLGGAGLDTGCILRFEVIRITQRAARQPPRLPIVRPAGARSTGIPMVSRIVEQVTSFALWYALWQLADHFFKVVH